MRKQIRPGLDSIDFGCDSFSSHPTGNLVTPVSRNDLKFLFDQNIFNYDMKRGEPLPVEVRHTKCPNYSMTVRYSTDRPKHYMLCPLCYRKWELHQLEKMLPKDFSSTFEYVWKPQDKWPYLIRLASNGVTKFNRTVYCTHEEAAEYYYKEFVAFKENGFKWSQQ